MERLDQQGRAPAVVSAAGVGEAMARQALRAWQCDEAGAPRGVSIITPAAEQPQSVVYPEQPSLAQAEGMCIALGRYANLSAEQKTEQLKALYDFI